MINQDALNEQKAEETRQDKLHREFVRKQEVKARIYRGVAEALGEDGELTEHEGRFGLKVLGCDAEYSMEITEESTHHSSWRSSKNGKFRVAVGEWGDRKSYPQRKDGSHNYESIADDLRRHARIRMHRKAVEAGHEHCREVIKGIQEVYGLKSYGSGITLKSTAQPGHPVRVEFEKAMTAEDAGRLIELLRENGFLAKSE